jgi:hypothetical protein
MKFTITEEEKKQIRLLYEQKDDIKEIPIPEILNKTVTFDGKCDNQPLGKIQLKIVVATHITIPSPDGTVRALKFELSKLDGKKGNKFRAIFRAKENEFTLFNQEMGNYDRNESVAFCKSGIIALTSQNLLDYIKSLKKYPVGNFPNEKTKLPKTDFEP